MHMCMYASVHIFSDFFFLSVLMLIYPQYGSGPVDDLCFLYKFKLCSPFLFALICVVEINKNICYVLRFIFVCFLSEWVNEWETISTHNKLDGLRPSQSTPNPYNMLYICVLYFNFRSSNAWNCLCVTVDKYKKNFLIRMRFSVFFASSCYFLRFFYSLLLLCCAMHCFV